MRRRTREELPRRHSGDFETGHNGRKETDVRVDQSDEILVVTQVLSGAGIAIGIGTGVRNLSKLVHEMDVQITLKVCCIDVILRLTQRYTRKTGIGWVVEWVGRDYPLYADVSESMSPVF